MTVSSGVATASGYAALLDEPNAALQLASLEQLNRIVDEFWPEIADHMGQIESLAEDKSFVGRDLASLVGSKVFFHLEEYTDAIRFALGAGDRFQAEPKSDYTNTIVSRIVDQYIEVQKSGDSANAADPRIVTFMERLFRFSFDSKDIKGGLGVAIETGRFDWVQQFIAASSGADLIHLLSFCQDHVGTFLPNKSARSQLLEIMVEGYRRTASDARECDWSGVAYCLYHLNKSEDTADILIHLNEAHSLMGLQVAIDVASHEDQKFSLAVLSHLEEKLKTDEVALGKYTSILNGSVQSSLSLEFLFRTNHTDLLLLENHRTSIDQRSSVLHNGVVLAHALMQTGTTNDAFLRKNLDWLAMSSHWAKFTATASLGAVHKGHAKDSKTLLGTYLPTPGQVGRAPYSEGGAFYAMGLIHANHHDNDTEDYLRSSLNSSEGNEVLQVGACLGLGLTCIGTRSASVYETLRNVLFLDSAVAGEAAGYAIGLVMAGSGDDQTVKDLLAYAHETHHEKIIRACSVAIALVLLEQEQDADSVINQMVHDSDAIVRYGGMFAIGMAYCGTSQNSAVKQLLHHSVSDVNDDVRRAAVISLGLVLAKEPKELVRVLKLLSQSFNPHVRYAVCIALGIGCSAMASTVPEAVALIEPLLSDVSEFVRQGALIGMGFVCQESNGEKVDAFRTKLSKMPGDKHEDAMCRFGALVASGLINLGGRNSASAMFTKSGSLRLGAAVGFCLFAQMWYWYPLILMVSLAASPTALIGLNKDLKMPRNFAVKSAANKTKPVSFAYPEDFKVEEKVDKTKLTSAVLSAAKDRQKTNTDSPEKDVEMTTVEQPAPEGEKGPSEVILRNPSRVVPAQEKYIQFFHHGESVPAIDASAKPTSARYVPVIKTRTSGFVVLEDKDPEQPEDLIDFGTKDEVAASDAAASAPQSVTAAAEEEAPPPEAFEWEG